MYTCTRNSCVFSPVRGSELTTHKVTHLQKIACAFRGQHTRGTRVSHLAGVYRINKFLQYMLLQVSCDIYNVILLLAYNGLFYLCPTLYLCLHLYS